MIWLLIAAASGAMATAEPPRLLNGDRLIGADDYPTAALENGDYGVVSMHLQVDAQGRVTGCAVTETSGSAPLDRVSCTVAKRRARFAPARNATGAAIASDYRLATTYGINEHQPPITIPMTLGVKALPPGYTQAAKLQAVFGADGHVMRCETRETSGNANADRAICGEIERTLVVTPPRSGSDEPAAAVRTYIANLTVSDGK